MARFALAACAAAAVVATGSATVFFEETFGADWADRWTPSTWKQDDGTAGEFTRVAGKWHGEDEEAAYGIQTGPDARFFASSAEMKDTVDTTGKTLVLQFSVKWEQKIDCGGAYIKLLPSTSSMKDFSGDTPYSIMFGPDVCGYSTKRVHAIFEYKGKQLLTKKTIATPTDQLTHVFTLIVKPDSTYQILIDYEEKAAGNMEDDWDFLESKTIKDPEASKPEDWDEREFIPDEEDVKPEGYDDIPEEISDPEASKPEDWDDEDDGEWEPPMITNPEFKGEWTQKSKNNPDYKGIWEAPDIPNPDYKTDESLYAFTDLKYVGFELWQVKAGSIFDNILVTDDEAYAKEFAEKTWGAAKEAESAAFDAAEAAKADEEKAERERLEAEAASAEDEEADEEDEEDDDYVADEEEKSHDEL